jgi:hypothetical protein
VRFVAVLSLVLSSCGSNASDASAKSSDVTITQERAQFREELNSLTYVSQCPSVHPASLEPLAIEIEKLKSDLRQRILASSFKSELIASQKEMDRQDRYSNEADCIGLPFPDSDRDALTDYRSVFVSEKNKLRALDEHFRSLLKLVEQ